MENKISDQLFIDFVHSSLSKQDMKQVEKALLADGEGDAIVHAILSNYEINSDYADSLLGKDTFDTDMLSRINASAHLKMSQNQKVENKSNKVDRKSETQSSIMSNKSKHSIMKTTFTHEEILKIQELVSKFNESENSEKTFSENLVHFYLESMPGTYPEEARKVVDSISKGINAFSETLAEALKSEDYNFIGKIDEATKNLSLEEKYNVYLNLLAAIRTIDATNVSENGFVEGFAEIKGKLYKSGVTVDEAMVNEMSSMLNDAICNNTLVLSEVEGISRIMANVETSEENASAFVSSNLDELKKKQIASLCAFIAYQNGQIKSLPEGVNAETIAISMAAGIEEAKVLEDVSLGRKTYDVAVKIIKIISAVALTLTLTLAIVSVLAIGAGFLASGIISLLGTSAFASIVCSILVIGSACAITPKLTEGMMIVLDKAGELYDKFTDFIRDKAYPYVKEKISTFVTYIRNRVNSGQIVSDSTVQTSTVMA